MHEPHPFRWYVPANARTLIIGTFPPVKSRWAFDFFYPNPRNLFWKILAGISGRTVTEDAATAISQRKEILHQLKVGVTDMGGTIKRLVNNSLDENLELVEHMPILQILDEHPELQRIILTSSSGKVSALAWFRLYLQEKNIHHIIPRGTKPLQFTIVYNKRNIDVYILHSPSPRAANRITIEKLTEMYKEVLTK